MLVSVKIHIVVVVAAGDIVVHCLFLFFLFLLCVLFCILMLCF